MATKTRINTFPPLFSLVKSHLIVLRQPFTNKDTQENVTSYKHSRKTLDAITNEDEKYKKLVELNVQEQCINVIKTAEVQKANNERDLKVYGWIFDIHSGKLIDLNINFIEILKDITKIYKISD